MLLARGTIDAAAMHIAHCTLYTHHIDDVIKAALDNRTLLYSQFVRWLCYSSTSDDNRRPGNRWSSVPAAPSIPVKVSPTDTGALFPIVRKAEEIYNECTNFAMEPRGTLPRRYREHMKELAVRCYRALRSGAVLFPSELRCTYYRGARYASRQAFVDSLAAPCSRPLSFSSTLSPALIHAGMPDVTSPYRVLMEAVFAPGTEVTAMMLASVPEEVFEVVVWGKKKVRITEIDCMCSPLGFDHVKVVVAPCDDCTPAVLPSITWERKPSPRSVVIALAECEAPDVVQYLVDVSPPLRNLLCSDDSDARRTLRTLVKAAISTASSASDEPAVTPGGSHPDHVIARSMRMLSVLIATVGVRPVMCTLLTMTLAPTTLQWMVRWAGDNVLASESVRPQDRSYATRIMVSVSVLLHAADALGAIADRTGGWSAVVEVAVDLAQDDDVAMRIHPRDLEWFITVAEPNAPTSLESARRLVADACEHPPVEQVPACAQQ